MVEADDGGFGVTRADSADEAATVEDEHSLFIQHQSDCPSRGVDGKRLIIGVEQQDRVVHAGYCSIST